MKFMKALDIMQSIDELVNAELALIVFDLKGFTAREDKAKLVDSMDQAKAKLQNALIAATEEDL